MLGTKKHNLQFLGKKYVYEMLKFMDGKEQLRFRDLEKVCPIEKMRNQRLREFEKFRLIQSDVKKIGRRPISVYSLSEKGKKVLALLEELRKILR